MISILDMFNTALVLLMLLHSRKQIRKRISSTTHHFIRVLSHRRKS